MRKSFILAFGAAVMAWGTSAHAQTLADEVPAQAPAANGNQGFQWDAPERGNSNNQALEAQIEALKNEIRDLKMAQEKSAQSQEKLEAQLLEHAPEKAPGHPAMDYIRDRFKFGSYGRVQPSMNAADMTTGRQARIVSPSPRVDEGSYVELYLTYTPYRAAGGATVDVVTTLAIDGDKLFHYDGEWDSSIAVRNLYVEVRDLWFDGFVLWAGSRMYRGDDIYLLDTWPLDNLNTYGGGLGWHGDTRTKIDLHFGTNRLKDDYQYEVVDVINERFVGEQDVLFLDRQRFIASLKAEQLFGGEDLPLFKAKLYAEVHAIGKGEFLKTQPEEVQKLPSDSGWLIGAQFGVSGFLNDSYVNLFFKYASGLAAYGEQTVPFGVATDLTAKDAKNIMAGLSAGIDILDYADILFGGYVRYFVDADGIDEDFDDGVEGVWDIRVTGHVGQYFRPGIELSQQLRRPNGVSPVTQKQELASIFKFSLLPAVRFGDGVLGRPEIRFNYTLSVLNDAARNTFAQRDAFRTTTYVHFIGLAAEWWFNL